jgi:hypothetical protein
MQTEVAHSGATKFTVEFDSATVAETLKDRYNPKLCMRPDLELPARIPYGLFDVLPGEAVFTSDNKRQRTSKGVPSTAGTFPRAISAINGLQTRTVQNKQKLGTQSHATDASNFFGTHTFIGVATTPCKSRIGQWDHFVVACQGLVHLKMDADALFGDTIVVDLPTSVHKADTEEPRAMASTPHLSAPRQKQTLVFRPLRAEEDVVAMKEILEEGQRELDDAISKKLPPHDVFSLLGRLYDPLKVRRVGKCVSNTRKGKLAKVVLYTTAF